MRSTWSNHPWAKDAPGEALHFVADMEGLRLTGLDTTVTCSAAGSVTGHLEWLEKQLYAESGSVSLLFLHHHVFETGISAMDRIMCGGLQEMAEMFAHPPCKPMAIATGHVHRPASSNFAGIPAYICGSICPANPLWFDAEKIPRVADPTLLMIHRFASTRLTSYPVSV